MRIIRDLIILLAIFGALWALFSYWGKDKTWTGGSIISLTNEEKLGKFIYDYQIKNEQLGKFVENKKINAGIDSIVNRLTNGLKSTYNYKVYIIKNDDVNAFTIPGGRIFIFTGLIEKLDSSAYLAAVLAHEIGHNEKHHLVNRLLTTFGLQLLIGGDEVVIGQVIKDLGGLKYARSQETEADEFAYTLLEKNNIHPNNFAKVMTAFIDLENESDLPNLEILNTHPGSVDRRRRALEYTVSKDFIAQPIELNWKEFSKEIYVEAEKLKDKSAKEMEETPKDEKD
jgi:beta-barrel assembly-enhancing protease